MDIRTELHNLKRLVLNESHISETSKEKIANRIFEIEKSVAINYTHCCKSDSEQLFDFLEWFDKYCTVDVKPNKEDVELYLSK